jgi:hypothetical protein
MIKLLGYLGKMDDERPSCGSEPNCLVERALEALNIPLQSIGSYNAEGDNVNICVEWVRGQESV